MKKRLFSNLALALVLTIGVVLAPGPVSAVPSMTFESSVDIDGNLVAGGTIAYDGVYAISVIPMPIYHLNVPSVDPFDFYNTPLPDAVDALLAFNTQLGTISITGTILDLGISSGLSLLSGAFSSSAITQTNDAAGRPLLLAIKGIGLDTKDPLLLAALGLDSFAVTDGWAFDFSLDAEWGIDPATGVDPAWVATRYSIDNVYVPEPGTLLLLSLGLAGCGFFGRRKTKA